MAASIPAARAAVAAFATGAGASEEQLDAIRLAVSEAVTNAVQYAYPDGPGTVQVTAELAGGELWLLVADDGRGITTGPDSQGLGLGLALVTQVSDGLDVLERSSGGTELRLRFTLPRDAGREAPDGQDLGSVASASRPLSPRFSTTT